MKQKANADVAFTIHYPDAVGGETRALLSAVSTIYSADNVGVKITSLPSLANFVQHSAAGCWREGCCLDSSLQYFGEKVLCLLLQCFDQASPRQDTHFFLLTHIL